MIVISATGDFNAQAFLRISRIVQGTNIMIVQSMVIPVLFFSFIFILLSFPPFQIPGRPEPNIPE